MVIIQHLRAYACFVIKADVVTTDVTSTYDTNKWMAISKSKQKRIHYTQKTRYPHNTWLNLY